MFSSASFSQLSLPIAAPLQGLVQVVAHHRRALGLASAFLILAFVATVYSSSLLAHTVSTVTTDQRAAYQPSQAVSRTIQSSYLPLQ